MLPEADEKFYDKYGKYIYPVIPGIFFVLVLINNFNWLLLDKAILGSDAAMHLQIGTRYYHTLVNGDLKNFFLIPNEHYPNFTYQLTSIFQRFFGFNDDMAVLSQFPFWLILIYSTYFIGLKLFGEKAGALASVASMSSPFIILISQSYLLDIPSAAMTAFSLACLFYCEAFSKPGWTLAFFSGSAIAMLTKWSSAFFIVVPFIFCFIVFLKNLNKDKLLSPPFIISLIISLSLAAGCLMWNIHHLRRFLLAGGSIISPYLREIVIFTILLIVVSLINFKEKSQKRFLQGIILFFILIWHFYGLNINNLLNFIRVQSKNADEMGYMQSPLYFFCKTFVSSFPITGIPFILAGIIQIYRDRNSCFTRKLFLWGVVGAMMILLFLPVKDARYFAPAIPFIAVLQTFWIFRIRRTFLKFFVLSLFIIVSFVGIMGWRLPFYGKLTENPMLFNIIKSSFALPPDKRDWKIEKIEESIHKYSGDRNTIILAFFEFGDDIKYSPRDIISHYNRFNSGALTWPQTVRGMPGSRFLGGEGNNNCPYQFALTPIREEEYSSQYKNLLILYLRKNFRELDENTYMDYFLLERNFVGKPILRDKIELPENITLFVMEMEINPPLDMEESH